MIRYQAKIYKDDHRYSVEFPDLPGCFSDGATLSEARKNARESLSLYLEEARDIHWKVPVPKRHRGKNYEWITPHLDIAIPLMIRMTRLRYGITQAKLAKRLGVAVQQLQKLETPGKSNPTIKTLAAISRALNSTLEVNLGV